MGKSTDLSGKRFGMLAVVRYSESRGGHHSYICQCDCGKTKTILSDNLRNGSTRSCGCLRSIAQGALAWDLTGQKFGHRTAIRRVSGSRSNSPGWECVCRCGTIARHATGHLRSPRMTLSCGCVKRERYDISNQRFGKLVALNIADQGGDGTFRWLCACDCGKQKVISGGSLRRGDTISCGCIKDDKSILRERSVRDRSRVSKHNRRARIRLTEGSIGIGDVRLLHKAQRGRCAELSCRRKLPKEYHVDHVMPIVLGGKNDKTNIQLLCPKCNQSKHAKHPIVWAQEMGRLL